MITVGTNYPHLRGKERAAAKAGAEGSYYQWQRREDKLRRRRLRNKKWRTTLVARQ